MIVVVIGERGLGCPVLTYIDARCERHGWFDQ